MSKLSEPLLAPLLNIILSHMMIDKITIAPFQGNHIISASARGLERFEKVKCIETINSPEYGEYDIISLDVN